MTIIRCPKLLEQRLKYGLYLWVMDVMTSFEKPESPGTIVVLFPHGREVWAQQSYKSYTSHYASRGPSSSDKLLRLEIDDDYFEHNIYYKERYRLFRSGEEAAW